MVCTHTHTHRLQILGENDIWILCSRFSQPAPIETECSWIQLHGNLILAVHLQTYIYIHAKKNTVAFKNRELNINQNNTVTVEPLEPLYRGHHWDPAGCPYTVEPLYRGHHWDPAGCPYTVEPLYRGHHWDPAGCPVYSGTSL